MCCGAHAAGAGATPPAAAAPAAAVPAAAAPSATASGWRKLVWRCSQPSSSAARPPVHGSSREEAPFTATVRCGRHSVARGGARGGAAAATESSQVEEGEEHLEGKDSGVKVKHLGRLRRGSSTTPQACNPEIP